MNICICCLSAGVPKPTEAMYEIEQSVDIDELLKEDEPEPEKAISKQENFIKVFLMKESKKDDVVKKTPVTELKLPDLKQYQIKKEIKLPPSIEVSEEKEKQIEFEI